MPTTLFGMQLPDLGGANPLETPPTNPTDAFGRFAQGQANMAAKVAAQSAQQTPTNSEGYAGLSGSADQKVAQHRAIIDAAAKKYGVPANLIAGVMMVESGGDGNAVGAGTKYGRAKGAMQVMPFWFKAGENPFDLQLNIDRGTSILAQNYKKRGNWNQAISDYNGTTGSAKGTSYLNKVMGYVNKWGGVGGSLPAGGNSGSQVPGTKLDNIMKIAVGQTNKPYLLGAKVDLNNANPSQFDCSSLVQWAFGRNGIQLPRLARQQMAATTRVDKSQLQPGDLIFFKGTWSGVGPNDISHVGIYLGNGKMVNATGSQGNGVVVQNINSPFWTQHYAGGGRVNGAGSASAVGSGSAPAPVPWNFGNIFRRA